MITVMTDKTKTLDQIFYIRISGNRRLPPALLFLQHVRLPHRAWLLWPLHQDAGGCPPTFHTACEMQELWEDPCHLPLHDFPYSQIPLKDHLSIIAAYIGKTAFKLIMLANVSIDEGNIGYVIGSSLAHSIGSLCRLGALPI